MNVVNLKKEDRTAILSQAERILRSGGLVVGPTDTVYGIFCDARDEDAIKKVFELKQRPEEKALPIFVKDIATARKYAYISDAKILFLDKIWPGAVTVVFKHKEKLPGVLTGGLDTIGIRVPNHQFMRELLSRLDFPLAQTSANVSAGSPAKRVEELGTNFTKSDFVKLIVDGGVVGGKPSTVIDFTRDEPLILRSGLVTKEEIDNFLGL